MKDLNFNIFNVIILAGIIHGFIFSIILIVNKKINTKTNIYLACTILSLVLSNFQYWLKDVKLFLYSKELIYIPFEFAMLPFFYLFTKSYLNKKVGFYEKIVLFVPFSLTLLYLLTINIIELPLNLIKIFNVILEYISILFSITVITLVWKFVRDHRKENLSSDKRELKIKTLWLQKTLLFGLLLCVVWFLSINIFKSVLGDGYYRFYPLWIGMSILVYWMAYTSIFQKKIFEERSLIRNQLILKVDTEESIVDTDKKVNKELLQEIFDWIKQQKMYLNPELKLEDVSKKFDISKGYLSQLISSESATNFNEYLNTLRVEEAKKMLLDPQYNKYTVLAIGLESGFNSKSSFYASFKKHTGLTPQKFKHSPE